ncbi:histidine kinase [Sutcliffiella horikoshii]|uniref:cache domain-containing sensor histidine kinase n=1 Tax=Sutcliffiella horikoshii TaxID=79883 RepID=UPI001CC1BEAC|nr:histidine kinase [Sutcliffiella horikoshii]UAL47141.1 histidine kinase [Sutcliffiella horikoshii]
MFFSLRNRLFFIFTLLLTVPFIVLSIIIPSWFTSVIEDQTKNNTLDMMDQYSLYLDSVTVQAEDLGKQVLVNQTTQQWLQLEENDSASLAELHFIRNEFKNWLSTMALNNSNTMSISVFLNDGTGIWTNHPFLSEVQWFQEYSGKNRRWIKAHTDAYQQTYVQSYVNSFVIPLYDIYTLHQSGVIKVNLPSTLLETALEKVTLGENGRVHLLSSTGENVLTGSVSTPEVVLDDSLREIVNSASSKGLIESSHNGEEYLVFYQKLSVGDWILFSEITKSELFSKVDQLQNRLLYTSGLIFILTILASYLFSTNIVRPLGKMTKAMEYIERGDFTGATHYMPTIKTPNDEVGYHIKVFNQTVDRLNKLIKIEYEANLRRKDAEYKALLLQINPHFMNNTLEIIGGLAAQGKNKDVINVSVYLGRMMSYSLNTHTDVVPLGQEINYIRNFTDILKVRYEDAISISIVEEPETKSLPIIKFIIQPLVENAAKYSFMENTHAEIMIKTVKEKDQVFISVEDNGIGMSDGVKLDLMNADMNDSTNVLASKGTSIGLKNVLGRLKLYYGDDFSFHIDSQVNKGTKITLCIKIKGDIHDESAD